MDESYCYEVYNDVTGEGFINGWAKSNLGSEYEDEYDSHIQFKKSIATNWHEILKEHNKDKVRITFSEYPHYSDDEFNCLNDKNFTIEGVILRSLNISNKKEMDIISLETKITEEYFKELCKHFSSYSIDISPFYENNCTFGNVKLLRDTSLGKVLVTKEKRDSYMDDFFIMTCNYLVEHLNEEEIYKLLSYEYKINKLKSL